MNRFVRYGMECLLVLGLVAVPAPAASTDAAGVVAPGLWTAAGPGDRRDNQRRMDERMDRPRQGDERHDRRNTLRNMEQQRRDRERFEHRQGRQEHRNHYRSADKPL